MRERIYHATERYYFTLLLVVAGVTAAILFVLRERFHMPADVSPYIGAAYSLTFVVLLTTGFLLTPGVRWRVIPATLAIIIGVFAAFIAAEFTGTSRWIIAAIFVGPACGEVAWLLKTFPDERQGQLREMALLHRLLPVFIFSFIFFVVFLAALGPQFGYPKMWLAAAAAHILGLFGLWCLDHDVQVFLEDKDAKATSPPTV